MASSPNMTLKLLVDKKAQKVLFAEATKECVDFPFNNFSLPLGTLIQLGQLKESLENFDQAYLQPGVNKDAFLNPKMAFSGNIFPLLNDEFYRCSNYNKDDAVVKEVVGEKRKLVGGYVKDVATCMEKEFVEFLFHIFSLPNLVQFMVGCLGQLKRSIEIFNQTYLQPGIHKDVIFNPQTAFNGNMFLLQLNDAFEDGEAATSKTFYRCINTNYSSCGEYVTEHKDAQCPYCIRSMNGRKRKVRRGYVKRSKSA